MLDIEETLSRELHEVAGALHVPAMPALPEESPRAGRHWMPVLAAAAVLLIVLGVVAVASTRGSQDPDPAPPTPTPTKVTEAPVEIPTTAPTIPYTLDMDLFVDGEQVPAKWWGLQTGGPAWLAIRADDSTWWWGRGPEPQQIEMTVDSPPVLSPNGEYVGMLGSEQGGIVTGFDTTFGGEGLGSASVDLGDLADGSAVHVRAVTDDGRVIVQGTETALLWLPLLDNSTVDLTETAPGQEILANTPAGLVVSDGVDGEQYLAEISDAGELTRIRDLPATDSMAVSPGAEWMAWTPVGTLGGEVTALDSLEIGTVDGGTQATFEPPDGWSFKVQDWAWEDDDNLVSTVLKGQAERMVRCSVLVQSCVLIDAP